MKVTSRQLGIALYEATKDAKGADLTGRIEQFVQLLATHHALSRVTEVIAEFEKERRRVEGIVAVTAQSAHVLTNDQERDIAAQIKALTGRTAEVTNVVDESVGGGVRLQFDDVVIDGTVKNRIARLRSYLRH